MWASVAQLCPSKIKKTALHGTEQEPLLVRAGILQEVQVIQPGDLVLVHPKDPEAAAVGEASISCPHGTPKGPLVWVPFVGKEPVDNRSSVLYFTEQPPNIRTTTKRRPLTLMSP